MLSLNELHRVARILEARIMGAILQRVVQSDDSRIFMVFGASTGKQTLLMVCRPDVARICTAQAVPERPPNPPSIGQYLKAHLGKALCTKIRVWDQDRLLALRLETRESCHELIFSILGSRSNVYLTDGEGKLIHVMRPLEKTRRELVIGQPWFAPQVEMKLPGGDRWENIADGDYLETIEAYYRQLELKKEAEVLSNRIETSLTRELSFLARKAVNLEEDFAAARQAEDYRKKGELLKGVLYTIKPGAAAVEAADYSSGEIVSIPIDPKLTPAQNLEAYFSRYQKDLRGLAAIRQQIVTLTENRSRIEALRARLQQLLRTSPADLEALQSFAHEPRLRRLLARYYPAHRQKSPLPQPAKKKTIPSSLRPKRFRTDSGMEIWVGKSDEGNDYLTTRLARGNDLFFHLEGYPGSHVVLRTEGNPDPPSDAILGACELAVHFSRQKGATRADVHVAHIKDVRKPKGVKRGLVYVSRGKTIHLRRDAKRLESILAARLDD